jgi:hypothetical protein
MVFKEHCRLFFQAPQVMCYPLCLDGEKKTRCKQTEYYYIFSMADR